MGKSTARNISGLIALTLHALGASLFVVSCAEMPSTPPAAIAPTRLAEGWNYVNGEWIHSDGYKYVNGQVVRTTAQTHKRPPKPPSKALLNSVKTKPAPTPDPNSAAAKAAERERNLQPRPAPQTGTNL
jgi:hypothetical protein